MTCFPARLRRVIPVLLLLALGAASASCGGGAAPVTPAGEQPAAQAPAAGPAGGADVQQLFADRCAKCHGLKGLGDGPSVGSLRTQAGLNLTILGERSDEEILANISAGKGSEMPPFELILTLEERQALVQYVRNLGGS
ncbi:MAG: cytochrome c [Chloroflexi bacterium]|nr:cytochrome c [Chloroflexota bacterium]